MGTVAGFKEHWTKINALEGAYKMMFAHVVNAGVTQCTIILLYCRVADSGENMKTKQCIKTCFSLIELVPCIIYLIISYIFSDIISLTCSPYSMFLCPVRVVCVK